MLMCKEINLYFERNHQEIAEHSKLYSGNILSLKLV